MMIKYILTCLSLLCIHLQAANIDLFILAGQSNAQGWTGDAKDFKSEAVDQTIPLFWKSPRIGSSNNKWTTLSPQAGRYPKGHYGLEITFARQAKKAGFNPAIFKYSLGGTSIYKDWKLPGQNGLYDDMVKQLKLAQSQLEAQGHTVSYRGFIWIQGESDAQTPAIADTYQKNLSTLLADLRKVTKTPELPMLLGMDEQHGWVVKNSQVLRAQQNIAAMSQHIEITSMYGLEKADTTHLTPAALLLQGKRVFQDYQNLMAKEEFKKKTLHSKNGGLLHYRIAEPSSNMTDKSPLILFLHGAGERGSDNTAQISNSAKIIHRYAVKTQQNAIIIAPQCPKNQQWVNVPWNSKSHTMPKAPSTVLRMATELLEYYRDDPRVDTTRIYITGLSMGGYGSWDILSRNPNIFAAAMPICGGADLSQVSKFKHVPIWSAHGAKDTVIPVSRTRDIINALHKLNANPKPQYTEVKDAGHNVWNHLYENPASLKWLFSQRKK